ncbi:MAG: DUF742 domain-containing protein [Streptomycetaceae bacterium]|nr:DUF742 domain-containing protein [Streptomycetaceae bacterium]
MREPDRGMEEEGTPDRLYVVTGGRAQASRDAGLDLVSLVVSRQEPRPGIPPEHADILRLCGNPTSIAEISSYLSLPFSAIAVLLADMVEREQVEVRAPLPAAHRRNTTLIQEVMNGLERL